MKGWIVISILCLSLLGTVSSSASEVEVTGGMKLIGGLLIFPDGTSQTTATLAGPVGPAGPTGPEGPLNPNVIISGDNTAVGFNTFSDNTTGIGNTASGSAALFSNTTGSYNIASGYGALASNTTGSFNIANGYLALVSNTTASYNIANGTEALSSNTDGFDNVAAGNYALDFNTTGSGNTAIGTEALSSNASGSNNTAIGYFSGVAADNLTNATAIGANALADASNQVRIGSTAVTEIGGQVAWSNLSDIREKKDIQDISFGLGFVLSLRPVEFRMKQGNDRTDVGFIAQDIETLLGTGYNMLGIGNDRERTLSLRYTDFIAPMVKAIQEQQQVIEDQNNALQQMRKELDELKTLVLSLTTR